MEVFRNSIDRAVVVASPGRSGGQPDRRLRARTDSIRTGSGRRSPHTQVLSNLLAGCPEAAGGAGDAGGTVAGGKSPSDSDHGSGGVVLDVSGERAVVGLRPHGAAAGPHIPTFASARDPSHFRPSRPDRRPRRLPARRLPPASLGPVRKRVTPQPTRHRDRRHRFADLRPDVCQPTHNRTLHPRGIGPRHPRTRRFSTPSPPPDRPNRL